MDVFLVKWETTTRWHLKLGASGAAVFCGERISWRGQVETRRHTGEHELPENLCYACFLVYDKPRHVWPRWFVEREQRSQRKGN